MKVAITSTGDRLESEMDSRFGRCPYYIVVDTDDMRYNALANDHAELSSGAGIQAASFLAEQGVQAVLTGNCGPKASQVFAAAGINVHTGYSGTVKEALEAFKQGGGNGPSSTAAPGRPAGGNLSAMPGSMGTGGGRGMGGGGGRGMGGGGGRGMGGCGGRGMGGGGRRMSGIIPPSASWEEAPRSDTLADLKAQAEQLKQQMAAIEEKISKLNKGQ